MVDSFMYQGTLLSSVPNASLAMGYSLATWTLDTGLSARFMCRVLNHVGQNQKEGFVAWVVREPSGESGARKISPLRRLPILPLQLGFVKIAAHSFPSTGSSRPWLSHHCWPPVAWSGLQRPLGDELHFLTIKDKISSDEVLNFLFF